MKPGKGSAFVRTKIKNMLSGQTIEKTFRAGEPIEKADVEKVSCQYTYNEVRLLSRLHRSALTHASSSAAFSRSAANCFRQRCLAHSTEPAHLTVAA